MAEVILEALSEGADEATVSYWHYEEGDHVSEGDDLVEIISEVGSVTISAPASGILSEVYFNEGDSVNVGDVLCEIGES